MRQHPAREEVERLSVRSSPELLYAPALLALVAVLDDRLGELIDELQQLRGSLDRRP